MADTHLIHAGDSFLAQALCVSGKSKKPRPVGGGPSHEKGPPLAGPDVDLDDVSACGGYSTPSSLKTCAVQVVISATDWLTDFTSDAVVRM